MRFFHIALLILTILTTSACTTSVRHAKNYESTISQNRDILILPPEAHVHEVSVTDKKRMYDYEYNMEYIISDQLIQSFYDLGFKAKLLHRKDIHEQNLHEAVARLHHNYSESRNILYREAEWDEKKAFNIDSSVGEVANEIGSKNNCGLLVLTDYDRAIKAGGTRAMNVMTDILLGTKTSQDADVAIMIVGVIEAKTGKILWSNRGVSMRSVFSSSSDKKEEAAQMKVIVFNILKPFAK